MDGTGWLDFGQELVVDGFAGAGGAGDGIADAYRAPDVKINHSPIAIAVNRANHPNARHYLSDICRQVAAALVRANAGPLIEFYARSRAA